MLSVTDAREKKEKDLKRWTLFTVFLCNSIPCHLNGSSRLKKPLASPVACSFSFTPLLSGCFLSQLEEAAEGWCWSEGRGGKCGKRRSAQSLAAEQYTDSACRSTFCSLSVVSHSQFRVLALFPHSLALFLLIAHSLFHAAPLLLLSLPSSLLAFLLLCFSLCLRHLHIQNGLGLNQEL